MSMDFLEGDDDSEEEENYEDFYKAHLLQPEKVIGSISEGYKDFAKNNGNRLVNISLDKNATLGDYLDRASLELHQEILLSTKESEEPISLFELLPSENNSYAKILIALALLVKETKNLLSTVDKKVYEPLLLFGEEKEFFPVQEVENNKEFHVTKMVGVLNEIHEMIKSLNVLLKNLVNQLHNLYNKQY